MSVLKEWIGSNVEFRFGVDKPGVKRRGKLVGLDGEFLVIKPLPSIFDLAPPPQRPSFLANRRYVAWIGRLTWPTETPPASSG